MKKSLKTFLAESRRGDKIWALCSVPHHSPGRGGIREQDYFDHLSVYSSEESLCRDAKGEILMALNDDKPFDLTDLHADKGKLVKTDKLSPRAKHDAMMAEAVELFKSVKTVDQLFDTINDNDVFKDFVDTYMVKEFTVL